MEENVTVCRMVSARVSVLHRTDCTSLPFNKAELHTERVAKCEKTGRVRGICRQLSDHFDHCALTNQIVWYTRLLDLGGARESIRMRMKTNAVTEPRPSFPFRADLLLPLKT